MLTQLRVCLWDSIAASAAAALETWGEHQAAVRLKAQVVSALVLQRQFNGVFKGMSCDCCFCN